MHTMVMRNKNYYKSSSPHYAEIERIFSDAYRTRKPISAENRKVLERDPSLSRFAHMVVIQDLISGIHTFAERKILKKAKLGI